jgi:release factor glutamine methyltransferase
MPDLPGSDGTDPDPEDPDPEHPDPEGPDAGDTVTWREVLAEARSALGREGLEHEARWLVTEASGAEDDADFDLLLGESVTQRGMARHDSMLRRRLDGEPLQYVLGHWPFRELDLMVDPRVLIPRPETEQVVEVALAELDRLGGRERETRVVDLGTGSGAIALSIALERVRALVWATDASAEALQVARANTAASGRAAARVTIAEGSWFSALELDLRGSFDMVVSNPPYVAPGTQLDDVVALHEPSMALFSPGPDSGPVARGAGYVPRGDGLDDVSEILSEAPGWLATGGVVVCEISPEQGEAALELATERFSEAELYPDLAGRTRALVARL